MDLYLLREVYINRLRKLAIYKEFLEDYGLTKS